MTVRIEDSVLEVEVRRCLDDFYSRRAAKLDDLDEKKLKEILRKKNPYLYRAVGDGTASTLARDLLGAWLSSSDETIFGNVFFEPLAIALAQRAHADDPDIQISKATGSGIDIQIVTPNKVRVVAVKSGPNIYNAGTWRDQLRDFDSARRRFQGQGKEFQSTVGFGYGRKRQTADSNVLKVAGEMFWKELTGDTTMYSRIIRAMDGAQQAALNKLNSFRSTFEQRVAELESVLLTLYSDGEGELDWGKIARLSSGVS